MEVYKNIRARRLHLGMTQEELAKKIGYKDRASIAKIETGGADLPLSKVKDIAKALRTTPGILMGWEDAPETEPEIHTIAAHALEDLTEEEQEKVLEYAKFIKATRKKDEK